MITKSCMFFFISSSFIELMRRDKPNITVYPKKYAHGFVVLCFVVVMQSFIMISHEVFIHIHQGCFAGTGAIVRLPQCQWSKPDGYGKISQCITTTKHSKAKTVCIFLGIYCTYLLSLVVPLSEYTFEMIQIYLHHIEDTQFVHVSSIHLTEYQTIEIVVIILKHLSFVSLHDDLLASFANLLLLSDNFGLIFGRFQYKYHGSFRHKDFHYKDRRPWDCAISMMTHEINNIRNNLTDSFI